MTHVPYANLHGHSTFSDGVNTPEEMVLAAIDLGMVTIGFSEHSYASGDSSFCMRLTGIPAYKREIRRLKEKYAGQIEVVLGIELDARSRMDDREDYEYIIGDAHYVRTPDGESPVDLSLDEQKRCINQYFGGDPLAYSKAYYDAYVEGVTRIRPDILGHIDLVNKFDLFEQPDPAYQALAIDALHRSLSVCNLVEMNTGAISRKCRSLPYPADFLLREIRDCGGEIILSSDTHAADTQTCFFAESLDILRREGFDHITLWRGGRFVQTTI